MTGRCETCKWWSKYPDPREDGECHGAPPTAQQWTAGKCEPIVKLKVWPVTRERDFCGLYTMRRYLADHERLEDANREIEQLRAENGRLRKRARRLELMRPPRFSLDDYRTTDIE